MAGRGSRFASAGYTKPKPLLDIHGVPMYKVVFANLIDETIRSVTFIIPQAWGLSESLKSLTKDSSVVVNVIEIDYVTEGPAASVELAMRYLVPDLPVVTANSDQYINASLAEFYQMVQEPENDGVILCMNATDPKWSYVRIDASGLVVEVREKVVISNLATIGIYGFRSARIMQDAFEAMKSVGDRTNGEYYLAPAYNYIVKDGGSVRVMELGSLSQAVFGLGVPSDFEEFGSSSVSKAATQSLRS
jgi:dTDP-glucose pyrophosphorylase